MPILASKYFWPKTRHTDLTHANPTDILRMGSFWFERKVEKLKVEPRYLVQCFTNSTIDDSH